MPAARVTIADKSTGETLTADEFDQIPIAVNDHAGRIDEIEETAGIKWIAGYSGQRCWQPDEDGRPVHYHAASSSTEATRAATVPGTNSNVWAVTNPDGDPVAAYQAARDS